MSPQAGVLLAAMHEHESLAPAKGPLADALWGQVMGKAVKLEWVVEAVHAVGSKADLAAADGHPWAWDYIRDRLEAFVRGAKAPKADAPTRQAFRRPEDIKQGRWQPSEADRRHYEAQRAAGPRLSNAELLAEIDTLDATEAEKAELRRGLLRVAS